jgi:hypothetical protein
MAVRARRTLPNNLTLTSVETLPLARFDGRRPLLGMGFDLRSCTFNLPAKA